jgi:predicted CXXCH cytochrome family protein
MQSRHAATRFVWIALFVIAATIPAVSVDAAKTCYDCHKKQKQEFTSKKSIHDPVKSENCEACHKRHGFSQKLVLVADDNELCYSCHKDLKEKFASGSVHFPVEKGVCWDCHNPHASDKKALLYAATDGTDDPASCLMCHNETLEPSLKAAHQHKPFTELQCLSCHDAHNSPHVGLLKQEGSVLCLSCHQKDLKQMTAAHVGKHTDALGCIDCHSGHASSEKGLLSDKTHPPFAAGDCETCHSLPDQSGKVIFSEGTTKNSVCATCHEEQTKSESRPVPHPAVTADNCSDCHRPHSSRFGRLLIKEEGKICQDGHTDILTASDKVKHLPVLLGECDKCHEIHGSDKPRLLKKSGSELCLGCHTTMALGKDSAVSMHAAAEDCLACHNPHEGVGKFLLKKPAEQLCADCHQPDSKALTAGSSHQPYMTSNCNACHQPHFSNSAHLLKATGTKLCLTCHTDISTKVGLTHQHAPATEDCLSCHRPHYAGETNLLNEPARKLCISCHDPADLGLDKAFVHSSAKDGDCTGCHDPHGSQREKLLSSRMTNTIVQGQIVKKPQLLTDKRSSLCYTCHETFGDQIEKSAAHKPVKDGNCEVCHSAHGSDHEGFVKAAAPELCTQCHIVDSALLAPHSGYDVAKADCLACHNPHLSTAAKLVRNNSHPPFAEKSCDNCHERGEGGSVKLVDNMTEVCSACHDGVSADLKLPTLHAPFEAGECTSCHRVHAADQPKLLKAETSTLCFSCHDDLRKADTLAFVHRPFGEKKCLECHKPHGSNYAKLLVKPKESFCFECHADLKKEMGAGTVHSPVKSGDCNSCHQPHAGPIKALLVTEKKDLCGKCHNLTGPVISAAHKGFDISNADCQNCHAPHVGQKGKKGLLLPRSHKPFATGECAKCHQGTSITEFTAKGKDLCATCHDKVAKIFTKPVIHPALEGGKECVGCHGPHVGFGKGLQKKDGVQQCLTCHNTKEFTGKLQHPPAFEDCGNCHDPHSSDYKKLLSTLDIIELCTTCHEDAKKTHYHRMGPGVTDPRTKTDLVCTGCHSPHSSDEKPLLVAEKTRKLCNLCHGTSHE